MFFFIDGQPTRRHISSNQADLLISIFWTTEHRVLCLYCQTRHSNSLLVFHNSGSASMYAKTFAGRHKIDALDVLLIASWSPQFLYCIMLILFTDFLLSRGTMKNYFTSDANKRKVLKVRVLHRPIVCIIHIWFWFWCFPCSHLVLAKIAYIGRCYNIKRRKIYFFKTLS